MIEHPSDPPRRVSDELERAKALADFLRDQEERAESARRGGVRRRRMARTRRAATIVVWVGIAYIWVGTPSWLTVEPPPEQTVQQESQSLRLNIFLQSQRVEAYRQERGRLPYVLEEAGPPFTGMEYRRRDNRYYEIRGLSNRVELKYESREHPMDFVGDAADLLDPIPRPTGGAP